ncbi:trigger factor [uncultured Ilyobacter sp.]|uniref:trigger factor n=1 Tax=uncultured Ilyobacter sp. TaxID=544433 RepID=UPI0029F54461|nr:trigger factor [uncultured Ilyobacter sp.]
MNYEIKKLENSTVEISLVLEGAEVKGYKDEVIKNLAGKADVPGFRKGKAPTSAIESKFKEVIQEEITEKVLQAHYETVLKETGIKPVNFVNSANVDLEDEKYVGKFLVDVYPEFEVANYKGLEAEKENFEINDEVLNSEIELMIEKESKLSDAPEGYKAQMDDTLDLAFEGFIDGEAFEGGKADSHMLKLGSKMFIGDFEEQLVGYEAGQEGEVNVSFPEDYHAPNLAGKPAVFKVKVNAVKVMEKPELNDEFAKAQGFESVEDLKAKKALEIKEREEARTVNEYRGKLLQQVVDNTDMALPNSMIEREIKGRIAEMEQQLSTQGIGLDMYLKMSGVTMEKMNEQLRPMAAQKVKLDVILDAIATAENITVSDEELAEKMEEVAKMYGMDTEKLTEELTKAGNLNTFKENVKIDTRIQKTMDFIVNNAK